LMSRAKWPNSTSWLIIWFCSPDLMELSCTDFIRIWQIACEFKRQNRDFHLHMFAMLGRWLVEEWNFEEAIFCNLTPSLYV
jgi:hypothetical protein